MWINLGGEWPPMEVEPFLASHIVLTYPKCTTRQLLAEVYSDMYEVCVCRFKSDIHRSRVNWYDFKKILANGTKFNENSGFREILISLKKQ